jgi:hypothetical protein
MPVHDWTRVDPEIHHSFHLGWIVHLVEMLNSRRLPQDYYAMSEQHNEHLTTNFVSLTPPIRGKPRSLTIRHVSGHRIIALLEIVSPANKDRTAHVAEFVDKAETALLRGIHLLLVDLFSPGLHDPQGMHGAIWERFDDELYHVPAGEPLTLASYVAGPRPEAYLEHLAVGMPLIDMPLFLNPDRYINVPLEATYLAAYQGMPAFWREVLEGRRQLP